MILQPINYWKNPRNRTTVRTKGPADGRGLLSAELLRSLRGSRTLREVERGAGIPNSYLSNVESGTKRPGLKTLSKLADYFGVPLDELLEVAGLPHRKSPEENAMSALDIHRAFDFIMADPALGQYERPSDRLSTDTRRFIVQLYEHFTGKRLL